MHRRRYLGISAGAVTMGAGCMDDTGDADTTTANGAEDTDASDGITSGNDSRETADNDTAETASSESKLIDAHLHLVPQETVGRDPLLVDDLVDWMDRHGVDEGVVLPLSSPEAYTVLVPSWWTVEQAQQYPDRLIPFFVLDPRTGEAYGPDTLAEQFERYVEEKNARGFGELKVGLEIGDDRIEPIYELCAEYDVPILFHSDDKAFMDDVAHTQLEAVLQSYPEVDFLGHGQGWWARISGDVREDELGGYPERSVEDGGPVPRLLSEYDNIYGELSGHSGYNALTRDLAFGQEFMETHADQLIFGTDYLYPGQNVSNFDIFDGFDLSDEQWAAIRYRNLESIISR